MAHALTVAAQAAVTGAEAVRARRGPRGAGLVTKSSGTDIALDADRSAEAAVVQALRGAFSGDRIVAEEGTLAAGGSGRTWFVDPIDGTVNYLYGVPHSAVTVALADEAGALCGAVLNIWRDELFVAARGAGAWVGSAARLGDWIDAATGTFLSDSAARLRTTEVRDLGQTLVATGFAYIPEHRERQGRLIARVLPRVRDIRRLGSASLDLAYVAAGRFDAYFESVDKPWDWLAGALLVREAGGRVTELAPSDPALPRIIASGPVVHDALVALLGEAVQNV